MKQTKKQGEKKVLNYIKVRIKQLKGSKKGLNFAEWMTNIDRIEELNRLKRECLK